jgi:hypothetical protein
LSLRRTGDGDGGNFYELRRWGDPERKAASEAIQAQNARGKAKRGEHTYSPRKSTTGAAID